MRSTPCDRCKKPIKFPRKKGFEWASGGIMHGKCATKYIKERL